MLQGAALAELQAFFPALAKTGAPSATTEVLLSALLDEGRGRRDSSSADGSARHAVALCCAVLVVAAGQAQIDTTVKQLLQMLKTADPGMACRLLQQEAEWCTSEPSMLHCPGLAPVQSVIAGCIEQAIGCIPVLPAHCLLSAWQKFCVLCC